MVEDMTEVELQSRDRYIEELHTSISDKDARIAEWRQLAEDRASVAQQAVDHMKAMQAERDTALADVERMRKTLLDVIDLDQRRHQRPRTERTMSATHNVKCDGCGADITYTGNSVDYRIVLANEGVPIRPGIYAVTDMGIYPSLDHSHHFCGLGCLDHWSDRRRYRDSLRQEHHEKWKQEHGTKHDNGLGMTMQSWPAEPEDVRVKLEAEFAVAALAAFPMESPYRRQQKKPAPPAEAGRAG